MSGSRSHALTTCWVQPVPVVPFCLRVLPWACARTSEHAELPREVATHLGAHDESSTTGGAAPQSQASLGQCPCACTKALSESRPTLVPRTSLCDVVGHNSAAHPLSLGTEATPGTTTELHVAYGPRCSVCLCRFVRGRVPSHFRRGCFWCFLVRWEENTGVSPWWK